ncbi:amidohydrolase family protein [Rubrimonas sp.]|uniref:amidohydrolase family protein n=1 Tax=Rubrimonas sp. TaxID=2036015 RepID=UPI002FDF03A8
MSENHDGQEESPDAEKPERSGIEASRRQFFQLSAATSAAAVGGLVSSAAYADDTLAMAGRSNRPGWAPTKYLIDVHAHLGSGPTVAELAPSIRSSADWGALRSTQPEKFAQAFSEDAVDDSAILLGAMDRYGVTHAIIQTAPAKGTNNQMVLDAAKNSNGRFFPTYRPEAISNAAARGTLGVDYGGEVSAVVRQIADELQSPAMSATLGVGEVVPITTEIHPAKIVRDMAPIMEVLKARGDLPIQFPTGYTGWKGVHYYVFSPVWADEVAGAFPTVPIVFTKMGRGIQASFDACLAVAMRNANVYFDMTDTTAAHLRHAISVIGADRIMYGSDLSAMSAYHSTLDNLRTAIEARLSAEEREQIAWKTANQIYKLGLEG